MKTKKNEKKYECKICDYSTSKKTDYSRHLSTRKHKNRTELNVLTKKNEKNIFECEYCNKKYKVRNSLWYHKKICKKNTENIENIENTENIEDKNTYNKKDNLSTNELVMKLMQEQIDITSKLVELTEKKSEINRSNNSYNNYNYNNNYNSIGNVNINIFLNKHCKNAINISDFTESLQIGAGELEIIKRNGIVNGISDVLLNKLKELEMTKRPIHCTDIDNNVLYVKQQNEWEKDSKSVKETIRNLRDKHIEALRLWEEKNPNWRKNEKLTDNFLEMTSETTNELSDTDKTSIISNISKHIEIKSNNKN